MTIGATDWVTILESSVDFELKHFIQVLDQWTYTPEMVSKVLLRAEIYSDHKSVDDESRMVHRKLLPRSKRDLPLDQSVEFIPGDQGISFIFLRY